MHQNNSWMDVEDLLLSIQADFQNQVYEAIEPYPKKFQEEILSSIHMLFTRFYFSSLENKAGTPSPYDIVMQERKQKDVIIPAQNELTILLRRSPIRNAPARRRIRMYVGLMPWEQFPIVQNVHNKNLPLFFPNDFSYTQLTHLLMRAKNNDSPYEFFCQLVGASLEMWRREDKILSSIFSKEGWLIFWQEYLKDAAKGVVSTDGLFDVFFELLRKANVPVDFIQGLLNHECSESDARGNEHFAQQINLYLTLTGNYASYFLFPLSIYFPVLSLFYVDPIDISQEIDDYKEVSLHESFCSWIAKPASEFALSDFGKELVSKWK